MDRMFIILLIWFAAIDDDVILDAMVWLTSVWCFGVVVVVVCCFGEDISILVRIVCTVGIGASFLLYRDILIICILPTYCLPTKY